ncbi:MAG TPA: VOC family protein [Blastocatellia bacterium]|nr:VOC family protein [Blastocatellia bacterium]
MKLKSLVPMLTVPEANIQETVDFYCQCLGFEVVNQMPGWAVVQRDGIELMFSQPTAHLPFDRPQFTGSLYLNLDDASELWEKLKDTATIVYPIEDFDFGMREFAIRDNNGYILQFGQEISDPS